jgi:hypothetical protein
VVVTRLEKLKTRADNVRSGFSASSIIFGSVIGFLIAKGLGGKDLSASDVALLAVWLYVFAAFAQNLLKTAENIVWHVPLRSNLIMMVILGISASLIGFFQEIIPIDDKVWAALVPAWIFCTFFTAIIERPSEKELSRDD